MGFIFSVFWGSNLCSHARFKGGKSQCALTPTHKLCPLSVKAVIQTDTYTLSSGLTGVFTFKDHSVFCFGGFNTWRIQSGIYSFITWWTDPCNKMLFKTGSRMEKEGVNSASLLALPPTFLLDPLCLPPQRCQFYHVIFVAMLHVKLTRLSELPTLTCSNHSDIWFYDGGLGYISLFGKIKHTSNVFSFL